MPFESLLEKKLTLSKQENACFLAYRLIVEMHFFF